MGGVMKVELGEERRLCVDSPIGLAAGFDKDAVAIEGLFDLGFSFVEIGRCVDVLERCHLRRCMLNVVTYCNC
jgi:dihydroorotate dehydrogenase